MYANPRTLGFPGVGVKPKMKPMSLTSTASALEDITYITFCTLVYIILFSRDCLRFWVEEDVKQREREREREEEEEEE